jgi:hypothetical protein
MADTNITGDMYGPRRGSVPVRLTYPFDFSQRTALASAVQLATIRASGDKPAQVIVTVQIVTAFNSGTSDTITVGTSTTATEIIPSGITAGTPGYYPSTTARARFILDSPLYLKYVSVGTTPTAGQGVLILEIYTENNKAIL